MLDSFGISLLGRAAVAAVLGFVVGCERKHSGSAAGGRTFALVCLSSAVLTTFAIATFPGSADRIIANLVTGVAFLGAGLILRRDTGEIKGLTTATISALTTSQQAHLTTSQLGALSATQSAALSTTAVAAMSSAQVGVLLGIGS